MRLLPLGLVALAGLVVACSSSDDAKSSPSHAADGGHAGGATPEGGTAPRSDASIASTCAVACGPHEECFDGKWCVAKSVTMPAGYAIDAIEVTRGEYAAWLATKPATTGQDAWCSDVSTFEPNGDCMKDATCKGDCSTNPQVCINLCQATAYCKAIGKHVCGKPGGGPAPFDGFAKADRDEWYDACSGGGKNTFPYADAYAGDACNGYDNPETGCEKTKSCSMRPGGEVATCQSPVAGYGGVFDLSGNVFEWEDSCNAAQGSKDRCRFRGGSYISSYGSDGGNALRCNYDIAGSRDDQYPNLGFRCCRS